MLSVTARAALTRIERAAGERRTPEHLRLSADAALLLGNDDVAVATLTEAVVHAPTSAELWNDLAVAHLATAAKSDAPAEHWTRALDAAAAAVALNPRAIEPPFNLALAAQKLDLVTTAADAWSRALEREASPDWRTEIERRQSRRLDRIESRWAQHRTALTDPTTSIATSDLAQIATDFPQQTKELVNDTLLAAWAKAWMDARRSDVDVFASRTLTLSKTLEQFDGDGLLRQCGAVLATTLSTRQHDASARRLAAAHIAYAEGRELSEQNRREAAGDRFAAAAAGFARTGSPCRAWATIQIAHTRYQARDLAAASRLLDPAKDAALALGHRSLFARAQWLLGLVDLQRRHMEPALHAYRDAIAAYERGREDENVAVVAGAAADTLRVLGERRYGWMSLSRAFGRLDRVGSTRRRYVLLLNASLYASDEGLPRAAMLFQNESLEAARARAVPNTLVEGLVRRARLHLRAGDTVAAGRDLQEAETLLPSIGSRSSTLYLQGWVDRIRGEWLAQTRAPEALMRLERALARFTRYEPAEVPAVHLARGRAALRAGDVQEAEISFHRGVTVFESRWRHLAADQYRVSYLDEGWELFEELIRLRAITQQNPDAAFQYAEDTRARGLAWSARLPVLTPDAVRRRLPPDALLLYYVALDDRLLVWGLTARRTYFQTLSLTRDDLARLVNAYRRLIEAGRSDAEIQALGRQLFEHLVSSTVPAPRPSGTWFLVPDGPLHALPFATLVDRSTGRLLAYDHDIATLPSARFLAHQHPIVNRPATPMRALAVGGAVPADPTLAPLPYAAREIRDVAASYADSLILDGATATPRRFRELAGAYDVIHFAGHARANSSVPWASHLVLSPDLDHPLGTLTMDELSRMRLGGVRLVFLAACETAAGNAYRGEGLVSLARPFLAAGATAVVSTLWRVDDRHTRAFVRAFHEEFVRHRDVAGALRHAQRVLLASPIPSNRLPRNWAAFVAVGR